jgi:hypothetical protein
VAKEDLIPCRTKEEAKARGRNGGIKSGVARRKIASIREALKLYLQETTTSELCDGEMTNAFAIAIAAAEKAKIGDVQAMTFVRDSIGEKPSDKVDLGAKDDSVEVNIKVVGGNNNAENQS